MAHITVLDQLKRKKILQLLERNERVDGRKFNEPRKLSIETGVIPKANGSARVRLGDTEVIAGVKVQPDRPFPDLGDKGIFICTAEILPLAHPDAEPGPPGEDVIELARVVDRGIRETGMIDLSTMVLKKDKSVIAIFSDNSIIDHDGNLFDACSYASTTAIMTARIPKWEWQDDQPVLIEGQDSETPITTIPTSVTIAKIKDYLLVDPNLDEWSCMDARITITTNSDGNICALQKGGVDGFSPEQIIESSKIAISVSEQIREKIKQVTQKN